MFIMFNMHVGVWMHVCMHVHACMCVHGVWATPHIITHPNPIHPPVTLPRGDPWNQLKFNNT